MHMKIIKHQLQACISFILPSFVCLFIYCILYSSSNLSIMVVRVVSSFGLVGFYRRFGVMYRFHFQDEDVASVPPCLLPFLYIFIDRPLPF